MIVHRTFTEATGKLNAEINLVKHQELRIQVEAFIRNEIKEEAVVSITETAITMLGSIYSITVWYRE